MLIVFRLNFSSRLLSINQVRAKGLALRLKQNWPQCVRDWRAGELHWVEFAAEPCAEWLALRLMQPSEESSSTIEILLFTNSKNVAYSNCAETLNAIEAVVDSLSL